MFMKTISTACLAFIFLCGSTADADASQSFGTERKVKKGTKNTRKNIVNRKKEAQKKTVEKMQLSRTEVQQNTARYILSQTESAIDFSRFLDTYGEIHAANKKAEIVQKMGSVLQDEQIEGKKAWVANALQNIRANGRRIKSTKWDTDVLASIKDYDAKSAMDDIVDSTKENCQNAEKCVAGLAKNYIKALQEMYETMENDDKTVAKQGGKPAKFFDPDTKEGKKKVKSWAEAHRRTVLG